MYRQVRAVNRTQGVGNNRVAKAGTGWEARLWSPNKPETWPTGRGSLIWLTEQALELLPCLLDHLKLNKENFCFCETTMDPVLMLVIFFLIAISTVAAAYDSASAVWAVLINSLCGPHNGDNVSLSTANELPFCTANYFCASVTQRKNDWAH